MKNIKTYTQTLNESKVQNTLNQDLLYAASGGNLDEVKDLLDKGAQVDSRNKYGWTPLHWASYKGRTDIARLLLDRGAEVDARDDDGRTPLYNTAPDGHTDAAMLLILNGADPFKAFKDPAEIIEFFDGDIDWMPEDLRAKLMRMQKGKQAFGM